MLSLRRELIRETADRHGDVLKKISKNRQYTDIYNIVLKYLTIRGIYEDDFRFKHKKYEDCVTAVEDPCQYFIKHHIMNIDISLLKNIADIKNFKLFNELYESIMDKYPDITIKYLSLYWYFFQNTSDDNYKKCMELLKTNVRLTNNINEKWCRELYKLYAISSWDAGCNKKDNKFSTLESKSFDSWLLFMKDIADCNLSRKTYYMVSVSMIKIIRISDIFRMRYVSVEDKSQSEYLEHEQFDDFIAGNYDEYLDKFGPKFNAIKRGVKEVRNEPHNRLISKSQEISMNDRIHFSTFCQFCAIKMHVAAICTNFKTNTDWMKASPTTIKKHYEKPRDLTNIKLGHVSDFILGSFLYKHILIVNKNTKKGLSAGDISRTMWPFAYLGNKQKDRVSLESKINMQNDDSYPNMRTRDAEKLAIILSTMIDQQKQCEFLLKFYDMNFGADDLHAYTLADWCKKNNHFKEKKTPHPPRRRTSKRRRSRK